MKIALLTQVALIAVGTFSLVGNTFAAGSHPHSHTPKAQQQMSPNNMPGHGHMHNEKSGPAHDDGDAHSSQAGQPGDPKMPARIVVITMGEGDGKMFFTPNQIMVRKGEQIRFKIKNAGLLTHELVVGTDDEIAAHHKVMQKFPNMEHDDPNSIRLKEKQSGEILWKFTRAGKFVFACLIPGHMEAGMKGTFTVEAPATN